MEILFEIYVTVKFIVYNQVAITHHEEGKS